MFEITYMPRYGDYKDFNTLKTGSILDMVQDASIVHSDTLGYSITNLKEMKIAWLMQGIKAEFISPAATGMPVRILTDVASMKGASSERGCIIMQNNKVIAKTVANWFTFDIENKRPCRIPKEIACAYPIHNFDDCFFSYSKPQIPTLSKTAYTICVRNKDLDTNFHLNNQKSAEILMDALPYEFTFRNMSIFYKAPAFLGDTLSVCSEKLENGFLVQLLNEKGDLCVAGEFTK